MVVLEHLFVGALWGAVLAIGYYGVTYGIEAIKILWMRRKL